MNFFQRIVSGLTNNPKEEAIAHMFLLLVINGLLAAGGVLLNNIGVLSTGQMVAIFLFVLISTVVNGLVKYLQATTKNKLVADLTEDVIKEEPAIEQDLAVLLHIPPAKGVLFPN